MKMHAIESAKMEHMEMCQTILVFLALISLIRESVFSNALKELMSKQWIIKWFVRNAQTQLN